MKIVSLGLSFFLTNQEEEDSEEEEKAAAPKLDDSILRQYTEYHVIKTNEKGKRQARILGIDTRYLYNKKPSGGGSVWRKQRSLSEVSEISQSASNPGLFSIFFTNGTSRDYECAKPSQANEIILK
eukprot:CAMPEP_0167765478 /NCGR_PEP_ID=MMETSP0110_2-20121227/14713_1 /TAXON_ID=629695 /ORGANISM="Gymnochlora sp., Strain CCMP2014" /LENGTH=125 /DNA_ID=CAMNT_0007653203 /DNA_START=33 /DNA_END=407 /DNA_ORIENTATION=+